MRKFVLVMVLLAGLSGQAAEAATQAGPVLGTGVETQVRRPAVPKTDPAKWPTCNLGAAPIDSRPAPAEAQIFPSPGGPVIMSQRKRGTNDAEWVTCILKKGEPSYRGADGVLRDVASNQPYFPVGWDAGPPPPGPMGPQGPKGDKGERGDRGPEGPQGIPGLRYVDETPVPQPEEDSRWGVTASTLIGRFSSDPIRGVVGNLTGRSVCEIEGTAFDVGVAKRSEPGKSFWRFTLAGKLIDDGSFTRYECKNCDAEVSVVADGMNIWGFRGERVFRIRPDWKIQPMVTVHAGVGYVSGNALRYEGPIGGATTTIKSVKASELFGSSWFPMAGAGAGFMGDIGNHFTWGVTVVGVEYPGVYFGGVTITYWPK